MQWSYPTISNDGKYLVGHRLINNSASDFIKINLNNGEYSVLKKLSGKMQSEMCVWPRLSEDGSSLFYLRSDKKALISYDLDAKEETEVYSSDLEIYPLAYSPDLSLAAFRYYGHKSNEIWLLSMKSSEARLLGSLPEGESTKFITWTPNGKHVIFVSFQSQKLYKIEVGSDKGIEECELDMKNRPYIQVHPDGKTVVFTEFKGQYQEVWVMENYMK